MGNIYTGIELGTDSVKVIVCEKVQDNFEVLASISRESNGIKNGEIIDTKLAVRSVSGAISQVNEMLDFNINKAILCVSPKDCNMTICTGEVDIIDYNEIVGADVSNCLLAALKGKDFKDEELVTVTPINFHIDKQKEVKDPKGLKGAKLKSRVVISTVSKEPLYRMLEVLKLAGIETIDIAFTSTGDYYTAKNRSLDNVVGAIINIGEESTNIAIFNKGIQIKNGVIPIGSYNVDKDISYIFKISNHDARKLKEEFAISKSSYADDEVMQVTNGDGEVKDISQIGISKVVEARTREILKLAKNEIKNLTNREIRYIIITGGLSELAGFQHIVDDEFGFIAKVGEIKAMGIRHNKFSSAYGVIQYFDDKLSLRGKSYNMVSNEDINKLINTNKEPSHNDNVISKVFSHFFDN